MVTSRAAMRARILGDDTSERTFEWRVPLGAWRWWLLGSLGVASSGCDDGPVRSLPVTPAPAPVPTPVPDPVPTTCTLDSPLPGGFTRCESGMVHRPEAGVCPSVLPRPGYLPGYEPASDADAEGSMQGEGPECLRDSDCTAAPQGYCSAQIGTYCSYGCTVDADCFAGQLCACGELTGSCVPATCRTDSDCEAGSLCGDFTTFANCTDEAFSCQTPDDACASDANCPDYLSCTRVPLDPGDPSSELQRNRTCEPVPCFEPGRPFLIGGSERLAASVERKDWYTPGPGLALADSVADPALRAELARGWAAQARMEHASVAAFARFALQLLALGAPPELIQRTAEAMQDEIRHARACFELACRHGGRDVGPGPLDITGAIEGIDLDSVVLGTLHEGCIGETIAALEAAEALQHCEDPAARSVLESIAAEEARHAELAWRFLAWALAAGPESLRVQVRAAFTEALAECGTAQVQVGAFDHALACHGLLSEPLRAALRARVLSEVIAPCARALLAGPASLEPGRASPQAYSFTSTT